MDAGGRVGVGVVSEPDNVVAIATRWTEVPPVDRMDRDWRACKHAHTMLDETLRTVGCRDCGEERLDPFEVLIHLSRMWRDWQREADELRKLNAEYRSNQRDKWERARDRHLGANPDHAGTLRQEYRGSWTRGEQPCRTCDRLEQQYDRRWNTAPEPPPGKLTDPA